MVGDGSTLFRRDQMEDTLLSVGFNMLYDLADNKMTTVTNFHSLVWVVNGEAWKYRRRLFA